MAHKAIIERYHDAIRITDGVYLDLLRAMREEIDEILERNKTGKK